MTIHGELTRRYDMHPKLRSKELGDWLRRGRDKLGISQERLAELTGVKQQEISKIERGMVPTPDQIAILCNRLGMEKAEAEQIIHRTAIPVSRADTSQDEFPLFIKQLRRLDEEHRGSSRSLDLFILREDAENATPAYARALCDMLRETECLRVSTLFRFRDRRMYSTFSLLVELVAELWQAHGRNISILRERLRAYYPTESYEENKDKAAPFSNPILLVMGHMRPLIYTFGVDLETFEELCARNVPWDQAQIQSMKFIVGPESKAVLMAGWIAQGTDGYPLGQTQWQQVPWPEITESTPPSASQ